MQHANGDFSHASLASGHEQLTLGFVRFGLHTFALDDLRLELDTSALALLDFLAQFARALRHLLLQRARPRQC